jgi:hypothetical protein
LKRSAKGAALIAVIVLALTGAVGSGRASTEAVPVNTAPPTISGTPSVGQTLTATDGTWSNAPTSFTDQWLRCNGGGNSCVSVASATQKTYPLVAADEGHTIKIRVTATNADGSTPAESAATQAIGPATSTGAPKNTNRPVISGTPTVGHTLTAGQGSWTGNPTAYTYQWQHCNADNIGACSDVVGATSAGYALHTADLGYRMRARVTAKNAKGSATATSAPTAVIGPALRITNKRPALTIISARFLGPVMYARFRICDDSLKNLTIIETDTRPGKLSYSRRFTTLIAPKPCGVYTRHWTPVARFRGPGSYTLTLRARDKSGFTSLPARRSFSHG